MSKKQVKAIEQANKAQAEAIAAANGEPTNGATKAKNKAKAYETPCACGCGEFARKAFVSSHDAKLAAAIRSTGRTGKKALSDVELDAVVARWAFASQNPRVAESPYFQRLVAAAGI